MVTAAGSTLVHSVASVNIPRLKETTSETSKCVVFAAVLNLVVLFLMK